MSTTEYNGWSNRETWAVALWINNDQYMQEQAEDYARTSLEEHTDEDGDVSGAVTCAAESLEYWMTNLLDFREYREEYGTDMPDSLRVMREDIGSLYRVDWHEIAESFISDMEMSA
jgi:hypothetical protein